MNKTQLMGYFAGYMQKQAATASGLNKQRVDFQAQQADAAKRNQATKWTQLQEPQTLPGQPRRPQPQPQTRPAQVRTPQQQQAPQQMFDRDAYVRQQQALQLPRP